MGESLSLSTSKLVQLSVVDTTARRTKGTYGRSASAQHWCSGLFPFRPLSKKDAFCDTKRDSLKLSREA